ncbi:hypothetical protein FQA39_LY05687 [Lamprigera yunnana]|nr:hypothetical protein FQA39_LY05687 [Lamprigera yunnana]
MSDLNYVALLFSSMITMIILMGSLLNTFEKCLPMLLVQTMRYGKFACKEEPVLKFFEVPKSWFKHFYVYSSLLTLVTFTYLVFVYILKVEVPIVFYDALDAVGGSLRQARISNTTAFLAVTLLTIQCCRRFYDTHYVSVFGRNSTMNFGHYLIGYVHYTGSILAILTETSKFVRYNSIDSDLHWSHLNYVDAIATILFLWAWTHQYKTAVILANLRKDKKGNVVTEAHKLPQGDWFNYVSSPHGLAEILMYLALTIILWGSITWIFIFAWVLCNQVETALLSHWWYKDTFPSIPKNRKAIIPFVY